MKNKIIYALLSYSILLSNGCIHDDKTDDKKIAIPPGGTKINQSADVDKINIGFKPSYLKDSISKNISDPISRYLYKSTDYIPIINFAFCKKNLVLLLHEDSNFNKKWQQGMDNVHGRYSDSISNITLSKELLFLKNELDQDSEIHKYSKEVALIGTKLSFGIDTIFDLPKYQSLLLMYDKRDGASGSELSNMYFDLIIMDGEKFLKAVVTDKFLRLFNDWLNEIDNTVFVAYGDNMIPPQILERKRDYITHHYANSQNLLMKKLIDRIRNIKIRIID